MSDVRQAAADFRDEVVEFAVAWYTDPGVREEWPEDDVRELLELAGFEPGEWVQLPPPRAQPLLAAEGDARMSRYENILAKYAHDPVVASPRIGRVARRIEQSMGSLDQRMHASPRIRAECPVCGALPNHRCRKADGGYTQRFHAGRGESRNARKKAARKRRAR